MTTTEIVNRFYQLNNEVPFGRATLDDLKSLLADDFLFIGPLMRVEGAEKYIELLKQFFIFHESIEIVKQFSTDDEVCTFTLLKLKTPAGQTLKLDIAERIVVENNKLKTHTIFYDPRGFLEAFPM